MDNFDNMPPMPDRENPIPAPINEVPPQEPYTPCAQACPDEVPASGYAQNPEPAPLDPGAGYAQNYNTPPQPEPQPQWHAPAQPWQQEPRRRTSPYADSPM